MQLEGGQEVSQSASMERSQFKESINFVKSNAKGATVDAGLFSTSDSFLFAGLFGRYGIVCSNRALQEQRIAFI